MDEGDLLVMDDLQMLDFPKALKLSAKEDLSHGVVNATHKHVAGCAVLNGVEHLLWKGLRLAPAHLDLPVPNDKSPHICLAKENSRRGRVDKGDKGAALLCQDLDGVNKPTGHLAQDLVRRGGRVNAAQVDGAVINLLWKWGERDRVAVGHVAHDHQTR